MVNKITTPPTTSELIGKVNEIVDDKQDTLVSGNNIKTINNQSLLGSGNISISGWVDSVNGKTGAVVLTTSDLTNDSGYITGSSLANVALSGDYDDLTNTPDLTLKADVNLSNINSSGKSFASGLSMPSSRYINLTLGASGTTYTAPANGYFCLDKGGTQNEYIDIRNNTAGLLRSKTTVSAPGIESIAVYMPCKKGDEITVVYTATGTTNRFRFIYAEGENV